MDEEAADIGGPRREFFSLFKQELALKSSHFSRTNEGLVLIHNISAVVDGDYNIIGKVLASLLLFGGPPLQCFAPHIADFLVYGELKKSSPGLKCIPDYEIQRKLELV